MKSCLSFLIPESCFLCHTMLWRRIRGVDSYDTLCRSCALNLSYPDLIFSEKEGLAVFSLFNYTQEASRLIWMCKGRQTSGVAETLALLLGEKFALENTAVVAGVVPMPPKVFGRPDHASIIAKTIAKVLNVPVFENSLRRAEVCNGEGSFADLRQVKSRDQKMKSRDERARTKIVKVGQSIDASSDKVLILADDVVTSGATLMQAWRALGQPPALGLTLASRPLFL